MLRNRVTSPPCMGMDWLNRAITCSAVPRPDLQMEAVAKHLRSRNVRIDLGNLSQPNQRMAAQLQDPTFRKAAQLGGGPLGDDTTRRA